MLTITFRTGRQVRVKASEEFAAALAFEINDIIVSRRLYEDARRYEDQPAPGADMQLFEHPDERTS